MIKRRRPDESDQPSEGEATEPTTEGQQAPESTGDTQPGGADESSADTADAATASSKTSDESTATSDEADTDAGGGGRKRNRRRRGKTVPSGDGGNVPEGASTTSDETASAPEAPKSDTGAADTESHDESSAGTDGSERAADDATGDGAGTDGDASEPPGSPPPRRRGGRGLAVFALLIALAAAGAAGWLGWRVLQLERQVAAVPEQREQALAPLASQDALDSVEQRVERGLGSVEDLQQRLSQVANAQQRLQGEHDAVLDDLRTRLETVEAALENLRDRRERDGADWRMAEVRYLVSIAVQRLAISDDIAGAVAALKAADRSLARMGDPRVIELRKQIVDDIEALQAVEPADVEGIALRIQNLAPRIPHLEPPAPPQPEPEAQPEPEPAADGDTARGWWGTIREQVGSLVTVRREAEPDVPSSPAAPSGPAPSAELPAGERLLLLLKDASRAALNHAPQAYDQAIDRALELLDAEYAESAPMVDRFREALEELQGRRVTTDLPDLAPTFERTEALAAKMERGGSGTASQGDN